MILPPQKPDPDPFSLQVLARLPLAEAFYLLWGHLAPDSLLDELFAQFRGRCYTDALSFAELVAVLADALTRFHGSAARAIAQALDRHALSTQPRAVYGKLARLPLPLAEAFLSTLTARLRPLFPAGLCRSQLPACLDELTVVVLDGKKIKNAAKRLLACRGRPGKLFGGKILAAYLPQDGLVVALAADPDGEANDIRLLPHALELARAAVTGVRLWVADAQFCDLDQPALFGQQGDHFLLRFTLRNSFTADPARPAQTGTNRLGQTYTQQWGWMGAAHDPRRLYVRRIVVQRLQDEAVIVVTDLLDEQVYAAADLLDVYLGRWQVEGVFQQITEVFELQHLIGCTPAATVFQAALCLVIYNVLQVLRGYAAQVSAEPVGVAELSTEKIFQDLHEELLGLHRVLELEQVLAVLPSVAQEAELRQRLGELLRRAWTKRWRKAKASKPGQGRPKAAQKSGAHTSVHKILQQARQGQTPRRRQT
jgi:hypothetical protein